MSGHSQVDWSFFFPSFFFFYNDYNNMLPPAVVSRSDVEFSLWWDCGCNELRKFLFAT